MYARIKGAFCKSPGLILLLSLISPAFAQTVQMALDSNMNFGLIEYSSFHSGELTLGTNGAVNLTGSGLYYQGGAVPAQISITGSTGIVEIRCDDTGALASSSGSPIPISDIEVAVDTGLPPGSADECEGAGGGAPDALVIDLDNSPNPKLFFGGKLNISSGALSGESSFTSSNGGGASLTLSAVFQ
ncbi:MAG: hypothetical protein DI586_00155 [Micavibrio aeruginosavorus]|uniref:Uncharacterized protein n=1 Tax=Micavibrio aeruginosavorus TaxID=349221 RepID=A0A2W5HPI1_9BACT|nr:MAG: hypothetical protein DI586_00155 [Micavibrio aeruginosavorus]